MFFYQISTLTTGKDTFTGGALDDMFTAAGAGVVGTAPTLTAGDILDGGAGNDTLLLDNQGNVNAGLQTVKNIENLKVYQSGTGADDWSGDVSEFAGLQNVEVSATGGVTLTAGASVTNVALNGAANAALTGNGITNVSAQNMAAGADGTLTVNNTTADHTLKVALDKVGKYVDGTNSDHVLSIVDANAETIALTSNGVKNTVQLNGDSKALKNIVIDGKGDLALTASGAAAVSIDGSKAEGDLTLGTLAAATTTITTGTGDDSFTTGAIAGKATINTGAGDDKVTLATGAVLTAGSTITLGDGDDTLTMAFAALTKDLKIDGGANSADGGDMLLFSTDATFTKDNSDLIKGKNFEVLGSQTAGVTVTADASLLGIDRFYQSGTANLVLTGLSDNDTVTFGAGTGAAKSQLTMASANDTLKLVLEHGDGTEKAVVTADVNQAANSASASNVTVSSDFVGTGKAADDNMLTLTAKVGSAVTLTGSQNLTYTNGDTVDQTIKAGTFTGDLTIIGNTGVDEITGGKGNDTFNVGQGNDVLHLSAGGNDVVRLMGKSGTADLTFADVTNTAIDGFTVAAGADQDQLFVSNFASLSGTGTTNWGGAAVPTQTIADNTVYTHKVNANIGDAFTGKFGAYFGADKAFNTATTPATGTGTGGSGTEAVIVIQGKDHSWVLYVDSGADGTANAIVEGDVKLVATLTNVTDTDSFDISNFC